MLCVSDCAALADSQDSSACNLRCIPAISVAFMTCEVVAAAGAGNGVVEVGSKVMVIAAGKPPPVYVRRPPIPFEGGVASGAAEAMALGRY